MLTKLHLEVASRGRVQYGFMEVMGSREVQAVLKECRLRREKEVALGLKPDPYHCMYMLPVHLRGKILEDHGIDILAITRDNEKRLDSIVEREYPAFKTCNGRIG